jgi:hypothetical protein
MGRPLLRPRWALAIFDNIPKGVDAQPISGADLADRTGLSYVQVLAGAAYLRDNYPELPLVSSKAGYLFSAEPQRVHAFWHWRMSCALTIVRRLMTGVIIPFLNTLGDTPTTRLVRKQFERAVEDLEALNDGVAATP